MTAPKTTNVLILSDQIPHSISAGNIQLLRLFADYPPNHLLVIGPPVPSGATTLSCKYVAWEPKLTRLNITRINRWKRTARAMNLIPAASPKRIRSLLGGFVPDVVLNLMQNSDYYEAAEKFCRAEGIPLVLIVHDTNEDFEPVFRWAEEALLRKDRRIYRFASHRFCVSPEMAEFNRQRFGAAGDVLYPIPDPDLRPRPVEAAVTLRQPPKLTIGYAGALGYGYGEMMLKLLPTLQTSGAQLELCSPKPAGVVAELQSSRGVTWHGYMEAQQALRLLQERCDALLLPYLDPPGTYERLYSTHFPSKLSDYLQTGLPILVIGPDIATGTNWWRRYAGSTTSPASLQRTIELWLRDSAARVASVETTVSLARSFGAASPSVRAFFSALRPLA